MNLSGWHHSFQLYGALSILGLLGVLPASRAGAQIIPDATLGVEATTVIQDALVRGQEADLIDGGALRGSNLFHSFLEFNVGETQRVYFANPTGVENILSRVTGFNGSEIMGTLGVDGGANLFVLNPNGIVFGPNAQLDVSGSFLASTADSFIFADGSGFSATASSPPELLTVAIPLGVQWGPDQNGALTNAAHLAVPTGQRLTLIGGEVIHSGSLAASGGTVEVLGNTVSLLDTAAIDVSSASGGGTVLIGGDYQGEGTTPRAIRTRVDPAVTINADATLRGDGGTVIIWADEATQFYGTVLARGGSLAGNGGFVEVSSPGGLVFNGQVDTTAPNGATGLLLIDPVNIRIVSDGTGVGAGEEVTTNLNLNFGDPPNEAVIFASTINGTSTNVSLQATNNITFEAPITIVAEAIGLSARAENTIAVRSPLTTNRGDINFTAESVLVSADISASTDTADPGGDITINAREIRIREGAAVFSSTTGPGAGGTLTIANAAVVEVTDNGFLGSRSREAATGRAGSMTIDAQQLIITNGGVVSTSSFGQGDGGDLIIQNAELVRVSGFSDRGTQSFLGSVTNSANSGAGSAGNTIINTQQLIIENGARVAASTAGLGNGGNLEIQNAEIVQVSGIDFISGRRSFLGARSERFGDLSGDAGSATISARQLLVEAGGEVSVGTSGTGNGGSLTVLNADTVIVRDVIPGPGGAIRSFLGSQSGGRATGSAGSTTINARQLIVEDGGLISAQALDRGTAGSLTINGEQVRLAQGGELTVSSQSQRAGNLTIRADSATLNNGRIVARTNALDSESGNIDIHLSGTLLRLENGSQITAAAAQGSSGGNITIKLPNGFLLAQPNSNNDILANANLGPGGNITVTAQAIFGIEERNPLTDFTSDFNASSEANIQGEITLLTLGIDPSRGLAELPIAVVDVSGLVATGCVGDNRAGVEDQGEFSIVGRGGITQGPTAAIASPGSPANLATLDEETLDDRPPSLPPLDTVPLERLEEAQGLVEDADGRVTIAAQGGGNPGNQASAAALNCNAL